MQCWLMMLLSEQTSWVNILYVVNDSDIVNYRHIEVGQLADHNMRVVKSGLSPSERYVTKALLKVRQGMKIKPIEQTNKLQ